MGLVVFGFEKRSWQREADDEHGARALGDARLGDRAQLDRALGLRVQLRGNCFRVRRTRHGQNAGRPRGVRGPGGARGGGRKRCAAYAAQHRRFPEAGCCCGGFHALKRCSPESSSAPLCQASFRQRFFLARSPSSQSESRTRMEPSSLRISTGSPESVRWPNKSKPGSASSAGIHSRMAGKISNEKFRDGREVERRPARCNPAAMIAAMCAEGPA